MKKLILLLMVPFALFSCRKAEIQKENIQYKDTTRYAVTFVVDDLTAVTKAMNGNGTKITTAVGDTLKNYASYLYYCIYNADGMLVRYVQQSVANSYFGTINDLQPAGQYTVFIGASKTSLYMNAHDTSFASSFVMPSNNASGWQDLFFKTFTVTVGKANFTQAVQLERQIAGFRLVVEDAIPADVEKITVTVANDQLWRYCDGNTTSYGLQRETIREYTLNADDKGVEKKFFDGYVGNIANATDLTIKAYNATGAVMAQKTLFNLQFSKNKRSIITGNLFKTATSPSTDYTITVDPTWSNSTVKF